MASNKCLISLENLFLVYLLDFKNYILISFYIFDSNYPLY